MELSTAMRTTAAVRSFTSEPVGDEVVRELLDEARFAPSGGNRQPWRVVLVRDRHLRQQLQELYQLSWREYVAHVASGLVPFAPGEATPVPDELGDHLAEVPVLLVVLAHLPSLAVTDNGLDRQSIVGGASVYPFVQNLLLAALARGLGGVMTTVLCRQEPAVKTLLGVPPSLALAGLVLLGHPERQVRRLRRRQVDEFCFVDSVGGPPLG
jgi:nitroreductase